MGSRWYSIGVVTLWLASMTWLVATKMVPHLLVGEAPTYRTTVQAQLGQPPIGWTVSMNGTTMGWALTTVTKTDDTTLVHSMVHFDRAPLGPLLEPLERILPAPLRALFWVNRQSMTQLEMEVESKLWIDALDSLNSFEAKLRARPLHEVIKMSGTVKDSQLEVTVQSGTQTPLTIPIPIPQKEVLSGSLSPQIRLPGLQLGQTWRVPTYNLYLTADQPIEYLRAEVTETYLLRWNGKVEDTWLVLYRNENTPSQRGDDVCGKLWVRPDGTILKQQICILNSWVSFHRMSDDEAIALEAEQAKKARARMRSSPEESETGRQRPTVP